jgi:hypothetical protein
MPFDKSVICPICIGREMKGNTTWGMAMQEYRSRARAWSEKTYRRTSMFAADVLELALKESA